MICDLCHTSIDTLESREILRDDGTSGRAHTEGNCADSPPSIKYVETLTRY